MSWRCVIGSVVLFEAMPRIGFARLQADIAWSTIVATRDGDPGNLGVGIRYRASICAVDRVCGNSVPMATVRENRPDGVRSELEAEPKAQAGPSAELDPRPGARLGWLQGVLDQHAFVVLVFYRGFW